MPASSGDQLRVPTWIFSGMMALNSTELIRAKGILVAPKATTGSEVVLGLFCSR